MAGKGWWDRLDLEERRVFLATLATALFALGPQFGSVEGLFFTSPLVELWTDSTSLVPIDNPVVWILLGTIGLLLLQATGRWPRTTRIVTVVALGGVALFGGILTLFTLWYLVLWPAVLVFGFYTAVFPTTTAFFGLWALWRGYRGRHRWDRPEAEARIAAQEPVDEEAAP